MATRIDQRDNRSARKRRGRKPGRSSVSSPVQSLSRALNLLIRVAEHADDVSLTDIAQEVGLAPSTTHRLLSTLEQQGFVEQDDEHGNWRIGVVAFTVGNAFLANRDIGAQSKIVAHQLMETAGETVNVAVLEGSEVVIIGQVECREMMRMVVPLGSRVPMHASGVGKAILSTLPRETVKDILQLRGLPRLTEHTIDNPAALRASLIEVGERGFAIDNEEHAIGLRCAAAPIFDQFGDAIAAISISGPKSRISETRLQELGSLVRGAAQQITDHIGGTTANR